MPDIKYKSDAYNDTGDTFRERYFKTFSRKVECAVCVLMYLLSVFLESSPMLPDSAKGFITQIQSIIAIYFTIRFGLLGMYTTLAFNAYECIRLVMAYLSSHNINLIMGLSLKLLTVTAVIVIARLNHRQELQKKQLQGIAVRDDLTNAYNRKHLHRMLKRVIEAPGRNNPALGLILIDIDNFKMMNDVHGHSYGDLILKITSELLAKAIKGKGILFRYGGDELAVMLPDLPLCSLEETALKIKKEFERLRDDSYIHELKTKLSLSMGLSHYPGLSDTPEELITHADIAMYHAKNLGKDKVYLYQDYLLEFRKSIRSEHLQLIGVFKALLNSISAKDKYTLGHSQRVSSYAVSVGRQMGLSIKDVTTLQYAGLLHDIGKIVVPQYVLNKVERLTERELGIIQKHPVYSVHILEPLDKMDRLIDYVKHHHERYDGKGYPDGLKGQDISLGARILCVVDSFDAMLSLRPYSSSFTLTEAVAELKRCSGTQFDPEIVEAFIKVIENQQKDPHYDEVSIAIRQTASAGME